MSRTKDEGLYRFRLLWKLRAFDEQLIRWRAAGRVPFTLPLGAGGAASLAPLGLATGDVCFPTARDFAGAVLARGGTWAGLLGQLLGSVADSCRGRQLPLHGAAPELGVMGVASSSTAHLLQAVGTGWAMAREGGKSKGSGGDVRALAAPAITMVCVGEAAATSGTYQTALQLARAWRAPVLFVVRTTEAVDGMRSGAAGDSQSVAAGDLDALVTAVEQSRLRAAQGPVELRVRTSPADGLVDAVSRYGTNLVDARLASEPELAAIANEVRAELAIAAREAEALAPGPADHAAQGVWSGASERSSSQERS